MMKRYYRTEDDSELFRKMQQDDTPAFEELYHRYFSKLSNAGYKRLQDRIVTEEIVQELFVNLWLKRHQLPAVKSPENYLYTLLRNAVIDWYRSQTRQNHFVSEWSALPERRMADATEQQILFDDLQQAYQNTVSQLPDKCRQVYLLHQKGQSVPQIAEHLRVSPKTVESHLLKAHYTLRHLLKDFTIASLAGAFLFF